jgi:hypothetical protein
MNGTSGVTVIDHKIRADSMGLDGDVDTIKQTMNRCVCIHKVHVYIIHHNILFQA